REASIPTASLAASSTSGADLRATLTPPRTQARGPLEDERFISLTEAAALSGLSGAQLRLLAKKGRLRAFRIGKNWVTTPEAVAEYMANAEMRSKDPYKYKRD